MNVLRVQTDVHKTATTMSVRTHVHVTLDSV